jgi:hypothetical protein
MEEFGGSHCEMEGCNQLDFLPFKCKACMKNLCLTHRSYAMHNCSSGSMGGKDATSLDCPICGISVKFFRGEDVNTAWEEHYTTTCTKEKTVASVAAVCSHSNCKTTLGTSNKVTCPKCSLSFCLAHRVFEEHSCSGARAGREAFLSRLTSSTPSTKTTSSKATTGTKRQSTSSTSASAGLKRASQSQLECPFCNRKGWASVSELELHVTAHMTDAPPASNVQSAATVFEAPTIVAASSSGTGDGTNRDREVCPNCNARFENAVDLVTHFEQKHSARRPASLSGHGSENGAKPDNKCKIT